MSTMDENFWDERYHAADQVWSGRPNATLVSEAEGLTPGRALDVGAGEGADAIWLAERGWDVVAVDISSVALNTVATRLMWSVSATASHGCTATCWPTTSRGSIRSRHIALHAPRNTGAHCAVHPLFRSGRSRWDRPDRRPSSVRPRDSGPTSAPTGTLLHGGGDRRAGRRRLRRPRVRRPSPRGRPPRRVDRDPRHRVRRAARHSRRLTASRTPKAAIAMPPAPPSRSSRRGERANQPPRSRRRCPTRCRTQEPGRRR